uniref:Uncharacterized protein n=1 Tax=Timema monikensis TaxID=170555 RepID=A0A7R9HRJ8_9NEOP|nr:unnamed protein product [Timema monikensis]
MLSSGAVSYKATIAELFHTRQLSLVDYHSLTEKSVPTEPQYMKKYVRCDNRFGGRDAALAASTSTLLESSMMEGDELYDPTTTPIANEEWSKKGGTSNLCRICANTSDYFIPIFEGEGLEHELSEKIDKHLPIKVRDSDSLPIHVCYQCASTLIAWHDLLLNCVEAEKKLLQIQQQVEQDDLEESKVIEFDAPSMDSDTAEDSVEATTPLVTPEEMEKSAPSTSKKNTSIKERPSLKRSLVKKSASSQKKARKTETEKSPVEPEDGPAEETVVGRAILLGLLSLFLPPTATHIAGTTSYLPPRQMCCRVSLFIPLDSHHRLVLVIAVPRDGMHPPLWQSPPTGPVPSHQCHQETALRMMQPVTPEDEVGDDNLSCWFMTKLMSPECSIANAFTLGGDKAAYFIVHCLAPFFHNNLLGRLKSCNNFVICFDEELNIQRGQMDIVIRFWDKENHKVINPGLNSVFFDRSTAEELLKHFLGGISPLPLSKLIQVSMNGPNVNLKLKTLLQEHIKSVTDNEVCSLLNLGTCGRHVVHGSLRTGVESVDYDISSLLRHMHYLFTDSPARQALFTQLTGCASFPLKFCVLSRPFLRCTLLCCRSQDVSVSTGGQDSTRQVYSVWIQTDDDTEEFLCDIADGIDGEGVVFVSSAVGKDKLLEGTQLPVENSHDWDKIRDELNNGTMIIDEVDDQTIFYVTPQTIKLMGSRRTVKWPPRSCVGEQLYECQFCLKSFRDGGVLLTHLRCHTGFTPFFCKFCGGKFKLSASLKHHLDTCLAAACAEATGDVKKELHPLAKNEQGFFECNYCGKKFKFKANLKEHIRYHTGRPRCKQRCDICTKKFLRRHELLVHLTTDHLDITYMTCDTCNKICISERDLADHKISHSNERPFICLFCGRKFKRKSHLTRHETNHRYQQQGLRPPTPRRKEGLEFKCELCGKNYSTKRQLQNHGFTHTGERNYECQHCGKRLGQFGTLKRHIRVVHEGIKDFVCELCQRSFTAKVSLTNHKRIHTGEKPFLCELCGKGFRTPQQMHLHERIHTNERPHSCPYCEKCFRRRPHLLVHIRTHTGEKPYECDVCRRGFAQKNDMKKHRVLHDRYRRYR